MESLARLVSFYNRKVFSRLVDLNVNDDLLSRLRFSDAD